MTSQPSPLRIERVIARLNIGGPAIHTILLTRHLREMGFESELVTGREAPHEGNMLDLAARNNVEPVVIPALGRELNPIRDISVLFALYRRFRTMKPDIVHTHTAKAGAVGRVAAWMAGVPVRVHTFHGHVFHGYFSPAKTRFFIQMERFLARISTRIIVLGERQKADILGLGIGRPEQFVQTPLGLDLEPFLSAESLRKEMREELGLDDSVPVAVIVARLVPIKAHEVFLRAAAVASKKVENAVFLIAGDGSERERLEQMTRDLGIDSSVRFLGFRSDLPRIYAGADLSVLSSNNEGMPVALIESLAAATPAVATDVGETRSIITDGISGHVVPPGNPDALAEKMALVLSDTSSARQMGLAGREHVYPRFSIQRLTDDLAQMYTSLMQDTGRRMQKAE